MSIASQSNAVEAGAALYPAELVPLFDDTFVTSWDLFEEYVARLALAVFHSTGLEAACRANTGDNQITMDQITVDQAVVRAGLAPEQARVPVAWILAMLASRGWIDASAGTDGEARYRLERPLPALEPDETRAAQARHDPRCLPAYHVAELAAQHYPAVLRAQMSGEQALFGAEGIGAWVKYFSNGNPLYAISNAVGAIAAEQALRGDNATVLEIGGGLGSGAEALLDRLDAVGNATRVCSYRFTEISALFLKRARRMLTARCPGYPFIFASLDIDRPFADAGVQPETFSLVYGVNVLHVARDLAATLNEVSAALRRGGTLVMSECVRPFAGTPLHLEFVFNLLSAFRAPVLVPGWRPTGGFLTPEQWTGALETNGFVDVRIYPDIAAIRRANPSFVVAAIVARRA
jgi:SAM-dependent methyltransferase